MRSQTLDLVLFNGSYYCSYMGQIKLSDYMISTDLNIQLVLSERIVVDNTVHALV